MIVYQGLKFSDFIQPLCLPEPENIEDTSLMNDGLTFQGWSPKCSKDHKLQEIKVNVRSNKECNSVYAKLSESGKKTLPNLLTDFMFCAGSNSGNSKECYGDSGGPAFRRKWNSKLNSAQFELIGIFSGRLEYGDGFYTRVADQEV